MPGLDVLLEMAKSIHRYWKYLAVFLILVLATKFWQLRKAADNLFYYDIKVKVVDEMTGEPIKGVTTHLPSTSSDDIISQRSGAGGGLDGEVGISGMAYRSREWGFTAPGYRKAKLMVDDDTKSSVIVTLEPKK